MKGRGRGRGRGSGTGRDTGRGRGRDGVACSPQRNYKGSIKPSMRK